MKVLVLGSDGYIGWPLTVRLLEHEHSVACVDDLSRRRRVREVSSNSLIPISDPIERRSNLRHVYKDHYVDWVNITLGGDGYDYIRMVLDSVKPDAIIHLAEQPSAPWSMRGVQEATATQMMNILGTLHLLWAMKRSCPEAHLIKLGTMGEYGTPECDIPEGKIPAECISGNIVDMCPETFSPAVHCKMAGLPFPRSPGSFYHLSKVHDTHNIIFACKTWGLSCTDIMQGVVYGNEHNTRFDYDQYFGTVVNRFCAQALIGQSLTVYGTGDQQRGFLPLKDSLQCIELILNNPPVKGEYRTINQFESIYTINKIAKLVMQAAFVVGLDVRTVDWLENPRVEANDHYYNPSHDTLSGLGYKPTEDITTELIELLKKLLPHQERVNKDVIAPTTYWR